MSLFDIFTKPKTWFNPIKKFVSPILNMPFVKRGTKFFSKLPGVRQAIDTGKSMLNTGLDAYDTITSVARSIPGLGKYADKVLNKDFGGISLKKLRKGAGTVRNIANDYT